MKGSGVMEGKKVRRRCRVLLLGPSQTPHGTGSMGALSPSLFLRTGRKGAHNHSPPSSDVTR